MEKFGGIRGRSWWGSYLLSFLSELLFCPLYCFSTRDGREFFCFYADFHVRGFLLPVWFCKGWGCAESFPVIHGERWLQYWNVVAPVGWVGDGSLWEVYVNLFYQSEVLMNDKKTWNKTLNASERSWEVFLYFVLKVCWLSARGGQNRTRRRDVFGKLGSLSMGVMESEVSEGWPGLINRSLEQSGKLLFSFCPSTEKNPQPWKDEELIVFLRWMCAFVRGGAGWITAGMESIMVWY